MFAVATVADSIATVRPRRNCIAILALNRSDRYTTADTNDEDFSLQGPMRRATAGLRHGETCGQTCIPAFCNSRRQTTFTQLLKPLLICSSCVLLSTFHITLYFYFLPRERGGKRWLCALSLIIFFQSKRVAKYEPVLLADGALLLRSQLGDLRVVWRAIKKAARTEISTAT